MDNRTHNGGLTYSMVKIDFNAFIKDRSWFGWYWTGPHVVGLAPGWRISKLRFPRHKVVDIRESRGMVI